MPRFEFKKYVELPVPEMEFGKIVELPLDSDSDLCYHKSIFMVGRFVGTSFRKVVSFDDYRQALKFVETYSGIPDQFMSDFVIYQFDLSVHFPPGYDPKPAVFGDYYRRTLNAQ